MNNLWTRTYRFTSYFAKNSLNVKRINRCTSVNSYIRYPRTTWNLF